jgi:tol-pal system beta propeller repeat protein TolB
MRRIRYFARMALKIVLAMSLPTVVLMLFTNHIFPPTSCGKIAYSAAEAEAPNNYDLMLVDERTEVTKVLVSNVIPGSHVWSPDGKYLAVIAPRDGMDDVYIAKADDGQLTHLTHNAGEESELAWSPDGHYVAFVGGRYDSSEIFVVNIGGGNPRWLTKNDFMDQSPVWSPDGTQIAFISNRNGNPNVYTMNADGTAQVNLTGDSAWDAGPVWSHDGKFIAFTSGQDHYQDVYGGDVQRVYIMNRDGSHQTRLTTNIHNASDLRWSPNDDMIAFYLIEAEGSGTEANIYAVDVRHQLVMPLTRVRTNMPPNVGSFDWSPDGSEIVYSMIPDMWTYISLFDFRGAETRWLVTGDDRMPKDFPRWQPCSQ